jgi:uncharacterized protein (TIGR02594 family)
MNLSKQFQWLALEDGPRHLLKAIEIYGTKEIIGPKHNPVIMGWAKEIGADSYYKSDEIPWCGLFIATIIKRAGRIPAKDPLRALNWADFGVEVSIPMLGDILTFKRDGGGHVGLYIGENDSVYYVLGGNQGNAVSIVPIAKTRLFKARRPEYNSPPLNIRKIQLEAGGKVSTNEA